MKATVGATANNNSTTVTTANGNEKKNTIRKQYNQTIFASIRCLHSTSESEREQRTQVNDNNKQKVRKNGRAKKLRK